MGEADTTSWYDANAKTFAERTQDLDMSHLQNAFLTFLPEGGSILDAGCGAGRDSKAFSERGFEVTMIDASAELAKVAEAFTGQPVQIVRFQEIHWENEFDGVWACASLLHVPKVHLPDVFSRIAKALKPNGVFYASFKLGVGERVDEMSGRHFTDMTEADVLQLVDQVPKVEVLNIWTNDDGRSGQRPAWVNAFIRRSY